MKYLPLCGAAADQRRYHVQDGGCVLQFSKQEVILAKDGER